MKKNLDLAVRWSDARSSLSRINLLGGVPVSGYPQHLRNPGGKVAVVMHGGEVALDFTVGGIDGPQIVTLAGGQKKNGFVIKAKRGSIRTRNGKSAYRLGIQWRAVGQFRYFDAKTRKSLTIDSSRSRGGEYLTDDQPMAEKISFQDFRGSIPGHPKDYPEAKLVARYVEWLNDPEGFGHNYIREAGLFVDLFDRRKWRLIEAKASAERERVRMAVGQLMDYRRFYAKAPSLGVLLPERPTAACLTYLRENRITAVWRTSTGRFSDSTAEHTWTLRRRRNTPSS